MNLFIIGDVHGCFHTFSALLRRWRPATERLVQVGDLVDRGTDSPGVVELARQLQQHEPGRAVFLMGNHDWGMARHLGPEGPFPEWLEWGGRETLHQYRSLHPSWLAPHTAWLATRPILWENDHVLISHAGRADTPLPFDPENPDGALWRRGPLLPLGKLQVVGHTPTDDGHPRFDAAAQALYIDTGAYRGQTLTGVRLSETGEVLEIISLPTDPRDIS